METIKNRPLSDFTKYKMMFNPNLRAGSFLRLAGLISKGEAKKMIAASKKSRAEWR